MLRPFLCGLAYICWTISTCTVFQLLNVLRYMYIYISFYFLFPSLWISVFANDSFLIRSGWLFNFDCHSNEIPEDDIFINISKRFSLSLSYILSIFFHLLLVFHYKPKYKFLSCVYFCILCSCYHFVTVFHTKYHGWAIFLNMITDKRKYPKKNIAEVTLKLANYFLFVRRKKNAFFHLHCMRGFVSL